MCARIFLVWHVYTIISLNLSVLSSDREDV
jgi:hypothetical protein